jgi:hypothetical protein
MLKLMLEPLPLYKKLWLVIAGKKGCTCSEEFTSLEYVKFPALDARARKRVSNDAFGPGETFSVTVYETVLVDEDVPVVVRRVDRPASWMRYTAVPCVEPAAATASTAITAIATMLERSDETLFIVKSATQGAIKGCRG